MDYNKLSELLYKNVDKSVDYYLNKYKKRELPAGAEVMRFAPSPTGFLHIGGIYSALISRLATWKTNGIFYLRLEDTDTKRTIKDCGEIIFNGLQYFGLTPDEGYMGGIQKGEYGNYIQSQRKDIYDCFAKKLVKTGKAFPCFCTVTNGKEDVLDKRKRNLAESGTLEDKDPCRDLTYEQIESLINSGKKFALKLKSSGDAEKEIKIYDLIKGERLIRENAKDVVLIKSNGIPPYALAHVIDDTLMGTTVVVRGEEWYPSLNVHLEIFNALGLTPPKYAHAPVLCKIGAKGNKRKFSKRYDPEANVQFFIEKGYPINAVTEYLINLLNSDFEIWRAKNPNLSFKDFDFKIEKISSNNPMFDLIKLDDISKNIISKMTAEEVYENALNWSKTYDKEFCNYLSNNESFAKNIFNIDRETPKPRKDLAKFSEIKTCFSYAFDNFNIYTLSDYEIDLNISTNIKEVLKNYSEIFSLECDKQTWFDTIKNMSAELGYATDNRAYKENPQSFKGNVASVCEYIRLAITGKKSSPDLFTIMSILGKQECKNRINHLINLL